MLDATRILNTALEFAVLAPSGHNTQPWSFRLSGDHEVELWADRTRELRVVDPDDRELLMGCGAALHHLRVALAAAGTTFVVELLPEPLLPDFLARVILRDDAAPDPASVRWRAAMTHRHTTRARFEARLPPVELVQGLQLLSRAEGAELRVLGYDDRQALLGLIERGDQLQGASKPLRRELASWIRGNLGRQHDGMPGYAFGLGSLKAAFLSVLVRSVDWGARQAVRDRDLAAGSVILAVLGTAGDGPSSWLAAGQALSAVLLEATACGLSASFLNQAVEVPALRDELRTRLYGHMTPQLVLRIGYYHGEVRATPRRSVDELMI